MSVYRPSTALCRWRHLQIVAPETNILGVPGTMSAATQENLYLGLAHFRRNVINFSLGMCWLQLDIYVYPGVWTWGSEYIPPAVITDLGEAIEGALAGGVRTQGYDSYSFTGPSASYAGGYSGLSFTDQGPNHNYYFYFPIDNTANMTEEYISSVCTHEFSHILDLFYDAYGGMGALMPFPDAPTSYRHADGTAFDPEDIFYSFLRATYSGTIEDIATSTDQGASAAVWALGPPRKNHPR